MTGRMVAAGFLVAGAGYVFGAFLAWVFRYGYEDVFLVRLGKSSFQAGHEVPYILPIYLVPSWERARTHADQKYGLWPFMLTRLNEKLSISRAFMSPTSGLGKG